MPVELGKDAFYMPKVNGKQNAAGTSLGLLCITHKNIYYIQQMSIDMKRTGTLTAKWEFTQTKAEKYEGLPFWDVVPELAKDVKNLEQFDDSLTAMADSLEGSRIIPLKDITSFKFGFFAQVTLFLGQEKYRIAVGGKKKREAVRSFLEDTLGLQ